MYDAISFMLIAWFGGSLSFIMYILAFKHDSKLDTIVKQQQTSNTIMAQLWEEHCNE